MIGLKPVVTDLVQELRETEMGSSKKFRVVQIIMKASGSSFPPLIMFSNADPVSSHIMLPDYRDHCYDCSNTVDDFIQWFDCF